MIATFRLLLLRTLKQLRLRKNGRIQLPKRMPKTILCNFNLKTMKRRKNTKSITRKLRKRLKNSKKNSKRKRKKKKKSRVEMLMTSMELKFRLTKMLYSRRMALFT